MSAVCGVILVYVLCTCCVQACARKTRSFTLHTILTLPFFFFVFFRLPVPAISSQCAVCWICLWSKSALRASCKTMVYPFGSRSHKSKCCSVFLSLCGFVSHNLLNHGRPCATTGMCMLSLVSPVLAMPHSVVDPHVSTHAQHFPSTRDRQLSPRVDYSLACCHVRAQNTTRACSAARPQGLFPLHFVRPRGC